MRFVLLFLVASALASAQKTVTPPPGSGTDPVSVDEAARQRQKTVTPPPGSGTDPVSVDEAARQRSEARRHYGVQPVAPVVRYGHPILKKQGTISKIDQTGFRLKETKEKAFLCCQKQTRLESVQKSRLGKQKRLTFTDFKEGDHVEILYDDVNQVVKSLKLLPS
jgi:hypothetical protein